MPSAVGGVEADVTVELSPLGSAVQICVGEGFISLPKPWSPGSFVDAPSASFWPMLLVQERGDVVWNMQLRLPLRRRCYPRIGEPKYGVLLRRRLESYQTWYRVWHLLSFGSRVNHCVSSASVKARRQFTATAKVHVDDVRHGHASIN